MCVLNKQSFNLSGNFVNTNKKGKYRGVAVHWFQLIQLLQSIRTYVSGTLLVISAESY